MRRKQWFSIDIPSLLERVDPLSPGLEISRSHRGPWIQVGMPGHFVWTRAGVPLRALPPSLNGLRILHLSDLHLGRKWGRPYDEFLAKIQQNPPDLILFTGDFVEDRYDHRGALPTVLKFLAGLRASVGIYAIFGNHDPDVMFPYLRDTGINFITHQRVVVQTHGGLVELIGFPGQARHDLDPDFVAGLPPREGGVPRIILSHYPDLLGAAMPLDPDLYLCGHTHGGQICLPNGWPGLTHDGMPRHLSKGIHRVGQTWYAVSNGFGFTGVSVRLFCPAEVVEFVLRAG